MFMKKFFSVILCSIILVLIVFGLIKNNDNKKTIYKAEKVLVVQNEEYSTEPKETEIVKTDEKEAQVKEETKKEEKKTTVVKKTTSKKTNNTNIKYGTFGRLYVSNYNVALYDYNVNTSTNKSLQTIVDEKDSAAYYMNNDKLVIADHNYQGFSVLVNLKEGTTSSIKFKDGKTIKYKLIKKAKGVNTGPDLVDTKGNSFFDMDSDIIMYTCYKDGIMVTLWNLA